MVSVMVPASNCLEISNSSLHSGSVQPENTKKKKKNSKSTLVTDYERNRVHPPL